MLAYFSKFSVGVIVLLASIKAESYAEVTASLITGKFYVQQKLKLMVYQLQ